jgi:hypothetical protein
MLYFIGYKGKPYGAPMTKHEAENKIMRMRSTVAGLEILPYRERKRPDPQAWFRCDDACGFDRKGSK